MLLNNLCECFNANILDVRDKPIIIMPEKIRINIMEIIQKKRDIMKKCEGLFCRSIFKFVATPLLLTSINIDIQLLFDYSKKRKIGFF